MVYSNRFVMCVLLKGVPQEELANGTVKIPFGEYSLRFRNKNPRRAVVQIYIDGENVSGGGYIIGANSFIDIKRHAEIDRAFKFVALDSPDAIEFGKNGENKNKEKGTIEARFYLEKERPPIPYGMVYPREVHHHHHYPIITEPPTPWISPYKHPYKTPDIWCGSSVTYNSSNNSSPPLANCCSFDSEPIEREIKTSGSMRGMSSCHSTPPVKDGCTVEGGLTDQSFYKVDIDIEDTFTSVKIFLQGYVEEVIKNDGLYCENCGAKTRRKAKFCSSCGRKQ